MNVVRPARSDSGRRPRGAVAVVAGFVCLFLLGTTAVYAWATNSLSAADESTIVTLTNQARASNGKAALTVDSVLRSIAEQRAEYMYVHNCLTHNSCTGGTSPMYMALINSMGYCLSNTASPNAGENIGWSNYPDSQVDSVMFNWWMGSSSHKANILQSSFTRIGVGAYKGDGRYGTMTDRGYGGQADTPTLPAHMFVQVFAHPCSTSPTPTPKPTPTPTPKPTPTPTPRPTPTPTPRPTATPTPRPTATPTPRPTATPTAHPTATPTDHPTATPTQPPADTAAPSDTASPGASADQSPSPDLTFDPSLSLDPRNTSEGGSAVWSAWGIEGQPYVTPDPDGPFPFVTPEPTAIPTPAPTAAPGEVGNAGLAVTDPNPDLNLLDTIVGNVVSSYFGQ